ncbi:nucleotidyltransferase family protein [Planomonospora sp. ID91781]|uniref:DNA polymerase n=1 Tax=Planomonospora sphaerica TaxID=161355 RepID=A0A171DLD8_9ACTN|nr:MULTISPECIES: nucleotidyltransferase family protein [Planomonospora]MBG0825658.1 nucleotidyltransferase family protein [Planomonospora sp. ID91781]GAT69682.1 DNA polymerase [Planomonospora sphaerica]
MDVDFTTIHPQLISLCERYGIAELAVFGSVARGDAREESDIDLLYVLKPGTEIGLEFFGFQEELEDLLGRKVDVVSKEGLHWIIRDQVLSDARVLYAA